MTRIRQGAVSKAFEQHLRAGADFKSREGTRHVDAEAQQRRPNATNEHPPWVTMDGKAGEQGDFTSANVSPKRRVVEIPVRDDNFRVRSTDIRAIYANSTCLRNTENAHRLTEFDDAILQPAIVKINRLQQPNIRRGPIYELLNGQIQRPRPSLPPAPSPGPTTRAICRDRRPSRARTIPADCRAPLPSPDPTASPRPSSRAVAR